jgi:hypothetical protein
MTCTGYWYRPQWHKLSQLHAEKLDEEKIDSQDENDYVPKFTPSALPESDFYSVL